MAFVLVQLKTALWPAATFGGVAVRVTLRILTVAVAVAFWPAEPLATAVYVVDAVGTTVTEPERVSAVWSSARIDGVIVTEVAFVLFQEMVVDWPCAMTAGWALMVMAAGPDVGVGVGVGLGVGLGPGLPFPTPPQPATRSNAEPRMNFKRAGEFLIPDMGRISLLETCREMKKQQHRLQVAGAGGVPVTRWVCWDGSDNGGTCALASG